MKGIQEYTKEELLKRALPYWKSVNAIFATSDGNFFYLKDEHYADSHVKANKLQKFKLTKTEYNNLVNPKEVIKEVIPDNFSDKQKEAFELLDTCTYKKNKPPYLKVKKQITDNIDIDGIIDFLKTKQ